MSKIPKVDKYIKDVLNGDIPVGKYTKLAVLRQVKDLERQGSADFPYYFDEGAAKKIIDFKKCLQHVEGELAKNPGSDEAYFDPEGWQCFADAVIYGWKKASGHRRFWKSYRSVARKNGKTFEAAGNLLYGTFVDNEPGVQGYAVATKKDQAKIVWEVAGKMITRFPALAKNFKMYRNTALIPRLGGKMLPLGRDSKTSDGFNPHVAVVDEYHAHKTDEMYNVIASGMGARKQPLIYVITTAGFDTTLPCYDEEQYVKNILEGSVQDERYFGIVYSMDKDDDILDPDNWIKANPNLGVSVEREWLEARVKDAVNSPGKLNDVLTKNLNVWTSAVSRWLNYLDWQACNLEKYDPERFKGRKCICGIDLATTTDLVAVLYVFPPDATHPKTEVCADFYVPEKGVEEREHKDKVPYREWIRQGWIKQTPGNVVDYRFIEADILRRSEDFNVLEYAYDPYNSSSLITNLSDILGEEKLIEFRQGFLTMSPAAKDFERDVIDGMLEAFNNPVLNWMANNITIKTDPAQNIKPVKPDRGKTGARVDGIIALIMAKWRGVLYAEDQYRSEGLLIV
jgi:phage terminase large subunit-like protein